MFLVLENELQPNECPVANSSRLSLPRSRAAEYLTMAIPDREC